MRYFISLTSYVRFRTSSSVAATTFCHQTQHISKWFAFPLVALAVGLLLARPCAATPFQWEYTGSLKTARFHHTATLLPDGRVLVAGGEDRSDALASAELYDPATGAWSNTASLSTARDSHTATLLRNGMVLVAGGRESIPAGSLASAELYDPATGTWSITGSLDTGRIWHTATLLLNGKVLVAGGRDAHFVQLVSAELYDPATGTWSPTGNLNTARYDHTATLLPSGMVLVAGGNPGGLDSAELYDPATGTWPLTGSLNTPRKDHTATLLPNGMVLVAGGAVRAKLPLASAEVYDPGIVAARVDRRGTFDNQENEVTFNFHANQPDDGSSLGYYSFCDPAAGVCITKGKTESLSITGINGEFSGKARLEDGTRVTFDVSVTDNGEPGILDTISITLSNGYSASGTLISGDIRIY